MNIGLVDVDGHNFPNFALLRQVPCDMDVLLHPEPVQMPGLFLVHNPNIHAVQLYGLARFHQIAYRTPSLRVRKEIVVQHLYPVSFRV